MLAASQAFAMLQKIRINNFICKTTNTLPECCTIEKDIDQNKG